MSASRLAVCLGCGLLFGLGLSLSGMLDPARVRGFLDIAGQWDPSLAFVLVGAVAISFVGVRVSRTMAAPVLAPTFDLPTKRAIDRDLILGSALFGIGWGLSGFCPGPAVASLTLGFGKTAVFVMAMLVGMAVFEHIGKRDSCDQGGV